MFISLTILLFYNMVKFYFIVRHGPPGHKKSPLQFLLILEVTQLVLGLMRYIRTEKKSHSFSEGISFFLT